VKYDNDLVLVAIEETLLLGMTNRLNETGRCCGMEINVGKKLRKYRDNRPQYRLW
jgi:hypothetical protein